MVNLLIYLNVVFNIFWESGKKNYSVGQHIKVKTKITNYSRHITDEPTNDDESSTTPGEAVLLLDDFIFYE